jgi:hypothetical protein
MDKINTGFVCYIHENGVLVAAGLAAGEEQGRGDHGMGAELVKHIFRTAGETGPHFTTHLPDL